jgi:Methyltransferase domain
VLRQRFRFALTVFTGLFVGLSAFVVIHAEHRRLAWRAIEYYGNAHECNICGRTMARFEQGAHTQNELQCPFCGSRPRHRTAEIYFRQHTDLFSGTPRKMLHIAPEWFFTKKFKQIPNLDYLSGDLNPAVAMVKMDINDIQFPANTFDVIYCSHVLEHVPDDRRAMRELARVLTPNGWGILAVPVIRARTVEDPTVRTDEDRFRVYGQADHVRAYGPDFADRLRESGFDVDIGSFASSFTPEQVERFGLSREQMYVVRKRKG